MRVIWLVATFLLLAGCGIQPSGVVDGGRAPTGVAPGFTLYFVDQYGELQPDQRPSGRLGTIADALAQLLTGPSDSELHTEITQGGITQVVVTDNSRTSKVIHLRVPLARAEVTLRGIDQLVCTTLATHVQSGGSMTTRVRIQFTLPTPGSDKKRSCPVLK